MAARVSKDNFEAEVLQAEIPVLVEFYSDSCIPCKHRFLETSRMIMKTS